MCVDIWCKWWSVFSAFILRGIGGVTFVIMQEGAQREHPRSFAEAVNWFEHNRSPDEKQVSPLLLFLYCLVFGSLMI